MRISILFLTSTLFIGSLALESLYYPTEYGNIKLTNEPDPNLLSGRYFHFDKQAEILFKCQIKDGSRLVMLGDAYGNVIIKFHRTALEILYIQLGQYHFIAHMKADRILHLSNPDLIPMGQDSEEHLDLYNQVDSAGASNISIQLAFDETTLKHECSLAEELSRALAEVFDGAEAQNPCVMELHVVSLTLMRSLPDTSVDDNQMVSKRSAEDCGDTEGDKSQCKKEEECEKPEGKDCPGLCGPRCKCWEWVCKDCCFHQGCADHDNCCGELGMDNWKCVFPQGFKCDAYVW